MQAQKQKRMTNQERSELSDKRMIAAAIALILEKGAQKTTLKEVGERAGYSRGLAGYRFGSKTGLFDFVLRTLNDYWVRDLTAVTAGKVGLEAILAATDKHYQAFEESPDNVKAFYILWFDVIGSDDVLKQRVINMNQHRQKDLRNWILKDPTLHHQHAEADAIAGQINSTINGIIYQWLLNPDDLATLKSLHNHLNQSLRLMLNT